MHRNRRVRVVRQAVRCERGEAEIHPTPLLSTPVTRIWTDCAVSQLALVKVSDCGVKAAATEVTLPPAPVWAAMSEVMPTTRFVPAGGASVGWTMKVCMPVPPSATVVGCPLSVKPSVSLSVMVTANEVLTLLLVA